MHRPLHSSRIPKGSNIKNWYKKTRFIIHWPVNTAIGVDISFQRTGETAYHYVIGADGAIRQYADDNSMIYHAGNWGANQNGIGISLEGGYIRNGVRVKPSQKAHESAGILIRELAKKHKIDISRNTIKRHSEVRDAPTMCSGTTDIDLIVRLAQKDNNQPPKNMTRREATKIVNQAHWNVFGSPVSFIASQHDAKMVQRGERNLQQLEISYRTEVEQSRYKGKSTSDRGNTSFQHLSYAQNYPDLTDVLNIRRNSKGIINAADAHRERFTLYSHWMSYGIMEGRTDSPQ